MQRNIDKQNLLRSTAEHELAHQPISGGGDARPVDELLHELRVHQVELEMQNEQLRQTQIELEQSRDRYIDFYDFAPVGYLTLSADGLIDEINLTAAAQLGLERNNLTHHHFASLVTTEDGDKWYLYFRKVLKSDKTQTCELALQRADGSHLYARLDCLSLINNGTVAKVTVVLTDVTEHKLAEQNQRIAAVAFQSQVGMVITDVAGTILQINKAYTAITGFTAEETIGKNPRILQSGRQDTNFYKGMWATILNKGFWEGEIWNKRKNGEVFPEHLMITAVKDEKGKTTNYVGNLTDITLSREAADEIRHLAYYDLLTRLPNRRLLLERLKQAQAASVRSGRQGALLFIDLDDFKTLNDTLGHDIGDILLQQVAQRLESCVREGDNVARLGGDEFVVMLENLSIHTIEAANQTETIANKILSTLNQPYQLATHEYRNTPSIGATLFGESHQSVEELLKQADIAMYQAKKAGRNTMRFFDQQMQVSINERATLEKELNRALVNRQFQLHYQIQVDSKRSAVGAEALIRWNHPERGLVSPMQFIPLVEETGQILPIGKWVLETACAQLNEWQQNDLTRHLTLSVNVSGKQFHEATFVDEVKAAVQFHGINPELLKLEPTESILLENIGEAIVTMNKLKAIGVRFALDDFGTGFSSLQYLKKLPLNQLKIDQSFVRDLVSDSNDQAIVRTIIAMAQSLNLGVIAEGVEMEEQQQILQHNGCNHYQGYLFGKPVPIEQFEALLTNTSKGYNTSASDS